MRARALSCLGLFLASCACATPAQKRSLECVARGGVIDCTKPELSPYIDRLKPLVAFLLEGANGDPSWEAYLTDLEVFGVDIIACTVQVVADELAAKVGTMPDEPDAKEAAFLHMRDVIRERQVGENYGIWRTDRLGKTTITSRKK